MGYHRVRKLSNITYVATLHRRQTMLDLVLASLDFESLANLHQTSSTLRRLVKRYLEIHKQRQVAERSEGSTAHNYMLPGADEALLEAAEQAKVHVVQFTLLAGADVHANNDEALRGASQNGHEDVVQILLLSAADPQVLEK